MAARCSVASQGGAGGGPGGEDGRPRRAGANLVRAMDLGEPTEFSSGHMMCLVETLPPRFYTIKELSHMESCGLVGSGDPLAARCTGGWRP